MKDSHCWIAHGVVGLCLWMRMVGKHAELGTINGHQIATIGQQVIMNHMKLTLWHLWSWSLLHGSIVWTDFYSPTFYLYFGGSISGDMQLPVRVPTQLQLFTITSQQTKLLFQHVSLSRVLKDSVSVLSFSGYSGAISIQFSPDWCLTTPYIDFQAQIFGSYA